MASRTRPSITKRNREQARLQRQEEKAAKRSTRAAQRRDSDKSTSDPEDDPDLAGIVAGPQPDSARSEEEDDDGEDHASAPDQREQGHS